GAPGQEQPPMKRAAGLLALAALVPCGPTPAVAEPAAASPARKLALVGGMVITGLDAPPLHHAAVIVEGERILAVGPAATTKVPDDADVIDTSGRVVLPGLIDAHVHLMILGHGDYERWDPWLAKTGLLERVMEISARQLLMAGVTSAVDLGAPLKESLSVRDRIARGEIPGPRMWMSGPWITGDLGDYSDALPTQILVRTPAEAARETARPPAARGAGVNALRGARPPAH